MILIISTLGWVGLLVATGGSVLRVLTGRGKDHDALAFSYALVAMVMLGFSSRWIFAPTDMFFLNVMRVFSAALAVFLIVIVRFYKRAS